MATIVSMVYEEILRMKLPDQLSFIKHIGKPVQSSDKSLNGQTIVLTGATSGIGLVTLHRLVKDQAHVIFVARSKEKAEVLVHQYPGLRYVLADFKDLSQVKAATTTILAMTDSVDAVIHCAGIHSTRKELTNKGLEQTLTVNHLASFLMTQELLPTLQKSKAPRVLFINSQGHRFGQFLTDDPNFEKRRYTGLKGYGAAKSAQLLSMYEFQRRFKDIVFVAMHPGAVKSNIGNNNGWLYRAFSRFVIQPLLRNPELSARAIHYLLAEPSIQQMKASFFNFTSLDSPAPHAQDSDYAKQVYEWSLLQG
jgi:NAD(P)-dependent dehydrogenase (short-subunit alcohol dehydrogenase family)